MAGLKTDVYESIDALRQLNLHKKYMHPQSDVIALAGYRGWLETIKK